MQAFEALELLAEFTEKNLTIALFLSKSQQDWSTPDKVLIETVQPCFQKALTAFLRILTMELKHGEPAISQEIQAKLQQGVSIEVVLCDNAYIQARNSQYRQKNSPTDVLTFHTQSVFPTETGFPAIPDLLDIPLASILISLEFAANATKKQTEQKFTTIQYLTERFVHGLLHSFEIHHDTTPSFEQVIGIQQAVLESVFPDATLCSPLGTNERS